MINRFIIILFMIFGINNSVYSNEKNCDDLKKFSVNYVKCKANLVKEKTISTGKNVKNKTISAGKNLIEDTKNYQKKEWSDEKKKLNKVKDKINETKEKVLN